MIQLPQNSFGSVGLKPAKKINMALLIGDLYNGFESGICSGAEQFAKEHDINLICFVGSELGSTTGINAGRNDIYELMSVYNVDGIIGISSTLSNLTGKKRLIEFYSHYAPLPLVSIGIDMAGMPGVLCDNQKSMRELLVHLIEKHKCREIAFIKGLEINPDTQARLKTYKEVLAEYDMSVNEDLIVAGDFNTSSGKKAVDTLLDKPNIHCDAIVGANDYMAIGALNELLRRGIAVPEEIKVVGFDDIAESRFLKIPLTTVRQPIFNIGYHAAKLLLEKLHNRELDQYVILPAQLVIRKSCGCNATEDLEAAHEIVLSKTHVSLKDTNEIKKKLVPKILSSISDNISIHARSHIKVVWIHRILDSLLATLKNKKHTHFVNTIEDIMEESIHENVDSVLWYFIFTFIFNNVFILLSSAKILSFTKKLFNSVMDIINNFGMKQHEMTIINNHEQSRRLSIISKSLVSVFEMRGLKEILANELPWFGIKSFYISLFKQEDTSGSKNYSRLLLAYEDHKMVDVKENEIRFISKEIIPGGFKGKNSNIYMVMPFHFEDIHVGFIVYEVENADNEILEILTVDICNTLKVINFYNNRNKIKKIKSGRSKYIKYKKSGLTKEKSREYFQKLVHFMETEKEYMDPDFTSDSLAERINISRHNLSCIINEHAGINFYDFVNSYRVKEIIKYMRTGNHTNTKIIYIAMEYGFKSKSTFNKAFKKHTDMTPTEFKNMISINNGQGNKKLMRVFTRYGFDV